VTPAPTKKKATPAKAAAARRSAPTAPRTLAEFMTLALAMETEAAERYAEFADAMEMHNNLEVAALFRKLAGIEGKHAAQIMAEMGWREAPAMPPGRATWEGFEAPETTPGDEVHYLMQPYHALKLAEYNEQRAAEFFEHFAEAGLPAEVRAAALEMAADEREHVRLIRDWLAKYPVPEPGWDEDPDPPAVAD